MNTVAHPALCPGLDVWRGRVKREIIPRELSGSQFYQLTMYPENLVMMLHIIL